jgi:dTDP-glucose 4,6-dehydratase
VFGTYTLLEAAKKNKIGKYIQISTDEVYGSIEKGAFRESDELKPSSPYSATKASADLLARSYYITYQFPVIITRSSNNFGPYQFPEKVMPLFITNILEDKPVPLYGDGKNVRDWVYVLDNCEAIDQVMHKGKAGEIYNIGGSNELANIELTKKILLLMGKSDELIKPVTDRLGHDRRYALDCFKLRSELGWKPQHDFNQALKDTINWYKENQQWWEKLKK